MPLSKSAGSCGSGSIGADSSGMCVLYVQNRLFDGFWMLCWADDWADRFCSMVPAKLCLTIIGAGYRYGLNGYPLRSERCRLSCTVRTVIGTAVVTVLTVILAISSVLAVLAIIAGLVIILTVLVIWTHLAFRTWLIFSTALVLQYGSDS